MTGLTVTSPFPVTTFQTSEPSWTKVCGMDLSLGTNVQTSRNQINVFRRSVLDVFFSALLAHTDPAIETCPSLHICENAISITSSFAAIILELFESQKN
eukprot:TRINITY_DN627_c0_g3_i1.p1 TRINITY_DN627_c0_g3~~TRINITY_DN627_c0_g3_i1.p1  ORF type:complete len:108 (-),score=14.03 TRINITY_DN627_c0_g3_i1:28-324(-)